MEPDETLKENNGRKTMTLSGGEKSFSTICLLLSRKSLSLCSGGFYFADLAVVWEAMGAPIRCLDEL